MPFIPDEQEKTVKIPIQVRGGRIQFYFDGPLPLLEEGVIGDLVVPYYALRRKDVATSGDIFESNADKYRRKRLRQLASRCCYC